MPEAIPQDTHATLGLVDWSVIALYGIGMLLVGWYFSRRSESTEEYLLGGRRQRPWAAGLSLFATMLSTLSYVAVPGEIIKHGPMILAGLLAYPVVFLVVGYLLIPVIMRIPVTSAYEILEQRLGLAVRLVGSLIFIFVRLAWMAAIIYASTTVIIIPVSGIKPDYAPLVAVALGTVTLAYTALGGIRAVIRTDVVQTIILFSAGILTVALITVHFSGFDWFPRGWQSTWDPPVLWFDASARITLAGAFMMTLGWFVCTCGSDQMVIQRYLTTPNAASARKVLGTSLLAEVGVSGLYVAIGFSLLAFYSANPQMLAPGGSVETSADNLFPRFMASCLPAGLAGLGITGLLAAAMSSLSSGVNSTALVITTDLIKRFSRRPVDQHAQIAITRWVSVGVGVMVVALSLSMGQMKGNLLEVINKVGNLMTAPLFLLFFLAIFVPWSRSFAAIVAVIGSSLVAIAIAYFEIFGLSFIWIIPCSLGAGVVLGCLLSLVPLGPTVAQRLRSAGQADAP